LSTSVRTFNKPGFIVVLSTAAVMDVGFLYHTAASLGMTVKENTFNCKIKKNYATNCDGIKANF
jgi:hypothetical protein